MNAKLTMRNISPMQLKKVFLTSSILLAAAVLSGCAALNQNKPEPEPDPTAMAIEKEIDAAIARVKTAPRWSGSMDERAQFASFASDSVSVSYQGDIVALMEAVASARGKTFSVTGPKPRPPIFVFVDAKELTFEAFLKDLDKQLGQRADLVMGDDYFEVRYR